MDSPSNLSYPSASSIPEPTTEASSSTQHPRELLKDRLYVGNLHPTVDEYALLQIFSKFGKVTKLDFLFHKSGLLKGKPRGYAFVEYGSKDDALKALSSAHDKLLRGRKLVVTFAHQAPLDASGSYAYGNPAYRSKKAMSEAGRPTTLSMLKSGGSRTRDDGTNNKIAMMEAKLRQMESTSASAIAANASNAEASTSAHPSLPRKPPPSVPSDTRRDRGQGPSSSGPTNSAQSVRKARPSVPLPSLPMPPPHATSETRPHPPPQHQRPHHATRSSGLAGVKIVKSKVPRVDSKDPSPKDAKTLDGDQTAEGPLVA